MPSRKTEDLDLEVSQEDIPEDPGPAIAGRTPIIGSFRRKNGMPVARDELKKMMGDM